MAIDDDLKVLPSKVAPDVVSADTLPPPPDTRGAAPSAADKAVADAVTGAPAPAGKQGAELAAAVASGDPTAVAHAAAAAPKSDLAKVQELQGLFGGAPPAAPGAPITVAPPTIPLPAAPPVTPGAFDPIPPLVADVQAPAPPGGVVPGAVGPLGPDVAPIPPPMPAGAPVAAAAALPPPAAAGEVAPPAFGPQLDVAHTPGLSFSIDGSTPGAGPLPPTDAYGLPLGKVAGLTDEEAARWAQTATPADVLEQKRLLELRKSNAALRSQAEADAANLQEIKRNEADLAHANAAAQAKADRIVADAMKLATTKTDPNRYLSTRTGSQRLRDILIAVAGGLLQARQGPGARNIGVDLVQREIDKDIDAQKQDIENGKYALGVRQNAVAEEFKRNGNLYEAAEKVRLATYQAAINRMQAEQQNFDPRGTSYLNYATAIGDMKARAADHVEKIRKESFEESIKERKERRDDALARSTIKHQANEDAIAFGRFGLDRDKQRTENQVWTPQQLAAINPDAPIPPISMTQKEYGAWLSTQKTGGEINAQARQEKDRQADRLRQYSIGDVKPRIATDEKGAPVIGENGLPKTTFAPLTNADGKPFLSANEGEHKTLSAKYLAASEITDIINEVAAIRDRAGGESKVWNSDDYQKLKELESRLGVLAKSGTEGMSSDSDMARLQATLGADDLTSFRSRGAGLEEAKRHTKTELNKALRIAKYTGPEIDFPNPYAAPAAPPSDQDIRDEELFKNPGGGTGSDDKAFKQEFLEEYRRRTLDLSPDERRAFEDHPLTEDEIRRARFSLPQNIGVSGRHAVRDINEPDDSRVHTSIALSPQQREILNDVAQQFDPQATLNQQRRIAELGIAARGNDPGSIGARALLAKVAAEAHTPRLRALATQALTAADSASIPETPVVEPDISTSSAAYEDAPPPLPKPSRAPKGRR
jgi:hypothetical protein